MGLTDFRIIGGSVMRGSIPKSKPKTRFGEFIQNYMDENSLTMVDLWKLMDRTPHKASYSALTKARAGETTHQSEALYAALAQVTGTPLGYLKTLNSDEIFANDLPSAVIILAKELSEYTDAEIELIRAHMRFIRSQRTE